MKTNIERSIFMKKILNFFSNKRLYWIWVALTSALFFYGCYAFWYTFLDWKELVLVALNALLQGVTAGIMTVLLITAGKREVPFKKQLIAFFVGAGCFEAVKWIVLALVNKDGLFNRKAIYTAYAIILTAFTVMVVATLIRASKGGFKIFQRALSLACAGVFVYLVFMTGWRSMNLTWVYDIYRTAKPYSGEIENSDIYAGFTYSTHKIRPTDDITAEHDGSIFLAKNEREGLQLMLAAKKGGREVLVSVTDFEDGKGNTMPVSIFKERFTSVPGYGNIFGDEYADALVPHDGKKTELEKNRVTAFYIETVSDKNQPAGEYIATVTVRSGEIKQDYKIKATVWNFALPDTPSTQTAVGLASSEFFKLNGLGVSSYGWNGAGDGETDDAQAAVYKMYYDYLLSHKVSPYTLPYSILDERADAYMSDPRVTSFTVPYPGDDEQLVKIYEKISSNPVWAAKAYFYPIDEPCDEAAYATYTEMTDRLAKLCPGYNMVTPFCTEQVEIGGGTFSSVAMQNGKSSILCGCSNIVMSGSILEEMKAARDENGSKLWWYVCCGPADEYKPFGNDVRWNNMFIYLDALQHRELFWQEKQAGLTGFLYWDSIYCDKGNPWETSKTWDDYKAAGDGCLIYPGGYIGLNEPVGTIRLKNVCDGIEDYDYLTLAEEALGADWVNERISKISTDINHFNLDYKVLADVRNEIGSELSK